MTPPRDSRTPVAKCDACGHEWFGGASVDALRAVGACVRCGGAVTFAEDADDRAAEGVNLDDPRPAHLAFGTPRK